MGLKAVILGGSSFSTPALFAALAPASLDEPEFVLVGRSPARLAAVARASRLLSGAVPPIITTCAGDAASCGAVLAGADIVILQMRIGGLDGREFDESFPLPFGLCGDEGLGAGGLSAAARAWPVVDSWLAAIVEHAPQALVLMVSSPVGILVRAVTERYPSLGCLGICEVPLVQLRAICKELSTDVGRVEFDYLGVNHLGWLYAVKEEGRDLIDEWARAPRRGAFPSASLVARWKAVPTKYMRLHFEGDRVVAEQRAAVESRSTALKRLQASGQVIFETGSAAEIETAVRRRDTPWYADAIAPLVTALYGHGPDLDRLFFLSGLNAGSSYGFADDDVLEFAYTVLDGQLSRIPTHVEPSAEIADQVRDFCRYERLATDAVLNPSNGKVQAALAAHPWVRARSLLEPGLVPGLARMVSQSFAGRIPEQPSSV